MHTIWKEGEIKSHVEGMMLGGLRSAFFFLGMSRRCTAIAPGFAPT